jgi:hypothetical protein
MSYIIINLGFVLLCTTNDDELLFFFFYVPIYGFQ